MEAVDNPSYFTLPQSRVHAHPPAAVVVKARQNFFQMGSTASSSSAASTPTSESGGPKVTNGNSRRSFRTLLRSLSANNPAVLQPREQQYMMARSRIPCTLAIPTPQKPADVTPSSEVPVKNGNTFNNENMVYYNLPAPPSSAPPTPAPPTPLEALGVFYSNVPPRRRHSIGTFFRDRLKLPSPGSSPRLEMDAKIKGSKDILSGAGHSREIGANPVDINANVAEWRLAERWHGRKRCNRCCVKGGRHADMVDILIISSRSSEDSERWVSYLKSCFLQISKQHNRQPFRILSLGLEEFGSTIPFSLEEMIVHVKLQIVIVCPQFLEYVYQNPGNGSTLGRLLNPDRVAAMLLGVDESDVNEQHRAALFSYQQWSRMSAKDQDESFVQEFLKAAMSILTKALQEQVKRSDKAQFSLLPKKVKEGQNKVIVLLAEPTEREDKIKITIDKNGEVLDVPTPKRRNPYTLHFTMPDKCFQVSALVSIHVEKNGKPLGCRQVKCESRLRELDQILRSFDNPVEFMCQTLGFSPGDREQLDTFLLAAFQRNIPLHFNLLHQSNVDHCYKSHASPEEYPTLLHFAARFGLEKLAWQLLECPGGEQACDIHNVCDLTPAEIAEQAGHSKLAHALRGYMQMNEFTSMYSYLKMVCENNTKFSGDDSQAEYHKPRPVNETYQVPPIARPVTPPRQYRLENMAGYLEMHPSSTGLLKSLSPSTSNAAPKSSLDIHNVDSSSQPEDSNSWRGRPSRTPSPATRPKNAFNYTQPPVLDSSQNVEETSAKLQNSGNGIKKSQEHLHQNVQDELVEIINDFKNNVFTISEVETLVENWKTRNDVKQSYRDKQEQLNQMREEYERIQFRMKEEMKRPTPFDRIRKFFTGKNKDNGKAQANENGQNSQDKLQSPDNVSLCQRPASSLSLQSVSSSSSSERMSTFSMCSGVSVGDSGTHSDSEDKKNSPFLRENYQVPNASAIDLNAERGIRTYEVPPAPRPVNQLKFVPPHIVAPAEKPMESSASIPIETRPPWPVPRPGLPLENSEETYYVTPETSPASVKCNTESLKDPRSSEHFYLPLDGPGTSPKDCDREYVNIGPQSAASNSTATPTDTTELPDYMNVSGDATPPPPIPPRHVTLKGSAEREKLGKK